MASNTHNTNDILARIVELRRQVMNISNVLQPISLMIPMDLGYAWGHDNISLVNAVGQKVQLPMVLLSSPTVSHTSKIQPILAVF